MKTRFQGRLLSLPAILAAVLLPFAVSFAPASAAAAPAIKVTGPVLVTMFDGKLDTKDAKVGDTVTLKVRKTLKLKDLEIPSGSKVIGKLETVQSKDAGGGTSSLGIQFEKIEMKHDRVMPIRGLIVGIGKISLADGVGYRDILSRGGVGSTPGLDPSLAAGKPAVDDVPLGSSLPGVALAEGLDAHQSSQMRGIKTDIALDPSVMVKIELFRAAPAS